MELVYKQVLQFVDPLLKRLKNHVCSATLQTLEEGGNGHAECPAENVNRFERMSWTLPKCRPILRVWGGGWLTHVDSIGSVDWMLEMRKKSTSKDVKDVKHYCNFLESLRHFTTLLVDVLLRFGLPRDQPGAGGVSTPERQLGLCCGLCWFCAGANLRIEIHLDHLQPLANGFSQPMMFSRVIQKS